MIIYCGLLGSTSNGPFFLSISIYQYRTIVGYVERNSSFIYGAACILVVIELNGRILFVFRISIGLWKALELRFSQELPSDLARRSNPPKAGLSIIMLCTNRFSYWSVSAYPMEHRWVTHNLRIHRKHDVATFNTSI